MKKNISILLILLLALAWYMTISTWFGNDSKYQGYMEEAKRLEEKEQYLDAIAQYEEAKGIKGDSLELQELIADDYYAMGDYKSYQKSLKSIISTYGPVDADIKKLYEFTSSNSSEKKLMDLVSSWYKAYPDNATVVAYYDALKGNYSDSRFSTNSITAFSNGFAVYELNGKYGVLDDDGDIVIDALYDAVSYYDDINMVAVKDAGKTYFVNKNGYKITSPEENYEELYAPSQKRILAKKSGKYGYLDSNYKEKTDFIYDDATLIANGLGAVKQGSKWAIIKRSGEAITDFIYDDVARNSHNVCSVNGVVAVKQGSSFIFINEKGEQVGENSFTDVKAFESEEPTGVYKDGKWYFMDKDMNLVLESGYQDVKPFVNGLAPFYDGSLWGFIDLKGKITINASFEDAWFFTEGGLAPVKEGDLWTIIELKIK